jgi:hypothetical protein
LCFSSLGAGEISRSSRKLSYGESFGGGCGEKRAVASGHDDVWVADSVGSREVDRIVPAQPTHLSQLACAASKDVIDFDKVDLLEQGLERGDGVAQLPSCEAAKSLGLGKSSSCLRVDEPDAHDPISAVPQRRGASGAGFGDQQWHNR